MVKNPGSSHNNKEYLKTNMDAKSDYWYSLALLTSNIGIIIKILLEFISSRKK